ncbi:MAG: phosphatidylinositol kinase [Chlorobaculum sp.]|nr:phosphatidylinositol kinase [Chlorobaculum sp.]
MRKAEVKYLDKTAGWLVQDEEGYHFLYDQAYLESQDSKPVSLTLPLKADSYSSKTMFPFFDGLIPEGWLLEVAERNWKINPRDRMGLLMNCCTDCVGAVSVHPVITE